MSIRCNRGRLLGLSGLATAFTIAAAGVAVASNATKGASYIGHYKGGETEAISFKVSANGRKVTDLSVQTPFKCHGGCGGVGSPSGGSASISKQGTFKVKLKITSPGSTKSYGSDTVTGTFLKGGKAKGTVSSHFNNLASSDMTASWTAVS